MSVYKVLFDNNAATSAKLTDEDLKHGDIGLKADKETVQWLALECQDTKTAIEIADLVVKKIWRMDAN